MKQLNLKHIKGILIDVDGTLVNTEKELASATKKVIQDLINQDYKVGLCTGRSYPILKNYILKIFPESSLHVVDDGGRIVTQQGQDLFASLIKGDLIKKIAFKALELNVDFGFGQEKIHYYNQSLLQILRARDKWDKSLANPQELKDWTTACLEIYNLTTLAFKEMGAFLHQPIFDNLNVVEASSIEGRGSFFKVVGQGINKGSTAQRWAENYNLSLDQVMMCGDGYNDISILKKAGLSVVVANGVDEAKELADLVIGHTDHNGLAKFLQSFLKEQL